MSFRSNFLSFFSLAARITHMFISVYRELRDFARRYPNISVDVCRTREKIAEKPSWTSTLGFIPSRPDSSRNHISPHDVLCTSREITVIFIRYRKKHVTQWVTMTENGTSDVWDFSFNSLRHA